MANNAKLLRANFTVLLAYPEYAVDPLAPTAAELNNVYSSSNLGGMVFNISCGILDDSNSINQTGSDTDSTLTICDVSEVENPTFWNYEVTFDGLRDRDVTANGLFNLLRSLTLTPDRPFYAITRYGKGSSDQFDTTDHISIFGVNTDVPVDIAEDGGLLQHGARFKTTGQVEINYKVAA
jgi:WD40 repeat protein